MSYDDELRNPTGVSGGQLRRIANNDYEARLAEAGRTADIAHLVPQVRCSWHTECDHAIATALRFLACSLK